ncbi:GNAT family N-acetyltransferase (plasmid) [Bacillus sp. CMF21]|nr:GNAT family N-acetyltransferase [Bacillus sp. CMF21]
MNTSAYSRHAELAYWFGVPFWGKGYATEFIGKVLSPSTLFKGFRKLGDKRRRNSSWEEG